MDAGFFFDELPTVDLGPDIPEARPDAQTTLASLPAELLLDITEYLKYGEVYTLMTVNRLLHGVALQHFYANVHAHPKKVKFPEQLRKDASLEEITRQTRLKNLGIIGGLLARKEHTDTLKFLHLVAAPTDSDNFLPLINTLIRAVISRSSRLRELRLPDFGNHLFTTPLLDFSGLTFPANYFTLSMVLRHPVTQDDVFASFAQDLFERTQPSTLRLLDWSPPEAVGYLTKDTGSNIESFQGRFKLRDTEDFSLEAMTRLFVEKMPNLIDLTIGFETSIPRLDQWNQKMTEDIVNSIAFLVQSLKKLRRLTIREETIIGWDKEVEVIKKLSSVPSPHLVSITLVSSGYNYEYLWYEGTQKPLEWRKWQELDVHVPIWSPDPSKYVAREWWKGRFKTSEIIGVTIQRMWPDVPIPFWFN